MGRGQGADHAHRVHLFVSVHRIHRIDGGAGRSGLPHQGHAFVGGDPGGAGLQQGMQFGPVRHPLAIAVETGILSQFRNPQGPARVGEQVVVGGGDEHRPVPGLEGFVGGSHGCHIPHAGADMLRPHVVGQENGHPVDSGFHQASGDFASQAGFRAPVQGRQHAGKSPQPSTHVDDGYPHPRRRAVGVAGDAHDAGKCLDQRVIAWIPGQRAGFAESADGAIHQTGVAGFQVIVPQTPGFKAPRTGGMDQDIGLAGETADDFLSFGRIEIHANALLVAVHRQKSGGHAMPR